MVLHFTDLFDQTETGRVVAKKALRIGALVIPKGHAIDPTDPDLGLPIHEWVDRSFDVDMDQRTVTIHQVLPSAP